MTVQLRGCRALITGGAGFIGSHIADRLVDAGASGIVVVDNFTRGRRDNLAQAVARGPVTIIEGDIRDRQLLDNVMTGIDVVFHQAAIRITRCADEPREALEVLVDGSFNVFDAAMRARVKKIVAASSASVYGMADSFPTREDHHPYHNRTLYGAAKAFNESLLRSYADMFGLHYVALRYFNVYGPRMDITGAYTEVFVRWLDELAAGRSPVIFGDGSQTMDLVHVRDVARANLLAAASPTTDVVCNIASGCETSLLGLAHALAVALGRPIAPIHGPARKVNPVSRRLADTAYSHTVLGFSAEMGLSQGLSDLVAWWRHERGLEVATA